MQNAKIAQLVTEAVALDRQIQEHAARLKEIKDLLATEAETRAEEAQATDGGGTSLTFEGADGCIARVTTTGRKLKSSIKAEGRDIEKVRAAAGRFFEKLFSPVLAYRPVENFRAEAPALLGNPEGRKLVKLCETAGTTSVSFEVKELAK